MKKKEYSPFSGACYEEPDLGAGRGAEAAGKGCCSCRCTGWSCLPRMSFTQVSYLLLAVAWLLYLSVDAFTSRRALLLVDGCLEMFRGGSIVVLSLVFAGMTTALVALGHPMSLLCVMAGLIYSEALGTTLGVLVGTIVTSIAVTLGCVLSFVVTRAMVRDRSSEWFQSSSTLEGLDVGLREQGLRLNLLLRLSPIVPYGFLNLAMGTTSTRLDDFTLGCIGMLPSVIVLSYFGSALPGGLRSIGTFADHRPVEMAIMYVTGPLLVVWAVTSLYNATKRAIEQAVKRRESLVDSYGWEL